MKRVPSYFFVRKSASCYKNQQQYLCEGTFFFNIQSFSSYHTRHTLPTFIYKSRYPHKNMANRFLRPCIEGSHFRLFRTHSSINDYTTLRRRIRAQQGTRLCGNKLSSPFFSLFTLYQKNRLWQYSLRQKHLCQPKIFFNSKTRTYMPTGFNTVNQYYKQHINKHTSISHSSHRQNPIYQDHCSSTMPHPLLPRVLVKPEHVEGKKNIWCIGLAPMHLRGLDTISKIFGKSRTTIKNWCKYGAPIAFDGSSYCAEYHTLFTWYLNHCADNKHNSAKHTPKQTQDT